MIEILEYKNVRNFIKNVKKYIMLYQIKKKELPL